MTTAEEFIKNRHFPVKLLSIEFGPNKKTEMTFDPAFDPKLLFDAMNEFALSVKDKEPVLRGCDGPCACSGRCKDIVGWKEKES